MGSTKKRREKDRDKDADKSRKRRHRSRSRSESPDSPEHSKRSSRKDKDRQPRKSREKRRHSESEDSDVPHLKTARLERSRSRSSSSGEIHDEQPVPSASSSKPKHRARSPSPPPRSSGAGGDASLSIEETNKLRIKLGLKPLQVDSGPPPSKPVEEPEDESGFDEETLRRIREEREKEADTFWKEKKDYVHKPAENLAELKRQEAIRNRLKEVREKRKLEERLMGARTLADSDDDEDDATKWVEKQRRAVEEKKLAEKRAKALAELDDEFGVGDLVEQQYQKQRKTAYSAKDMRGLKVLHSQERIAAGESVILTLQDKGVLDEEDDALVNVNYVDDEKFEKNIETRRLRPELHGYNAYDEIEFDNQGNLKGKSVLGKYDEEIDKKSGVKSFVLGEDISEEQRKAQIREKMQKANKILESLETGASKIASDFYTEEEIVAFKKPKKKVKKVRKVLRADDLLKMESEAGSIPGTTKKDRGSRSRVIDDDEVGISSGDNYKSEPMDLDVDDLPPPPVDLSLDDIWKVKDVDEADADFQLALQKARKAQQKKLTKIAPESIVDRLKIEPEDSYGDGSGSIVLHATAEFCRTLGDIPTETGDDIYGDEQMDFEQEETTEVVKKEERGRWAEVEIDETPVDITREPDVEEAPILEEEPSVGTGLGGALQLAMKKGYIDQAPKKRGAAIGKMKDLQAQNYSIEDKNYDDDRIQRRDVYAGPTTEFREKDGYKPDVKLEYVDEDGKVISSKEAFRLLSHKFHGKGSGKNKVDKKRRKMEQEKLMQHMNSTDTPLNTLELLQSKQKETHSPYVVLTGKSQNTSLSKTSR